MTEPESTAEPTKLQIEAQRAALTYKGGFKFMQDMAQKARQNKAWVPTQNQAVAILRSVAWQHTDRPVRRRR